MSSNARQQSLVFLNKAMRKLEEVDARVNSCHGSDKARLASTIEGVEEGRALDLENMSLLEEKHEKINWEIEKLERSLNTRQQLLEASMRLLVCLRFFMPCHSSIAES
jgi:hypothetical protein